MADNYLEKRMEDYRSGLLKKKRDVKTRFSNKSAVVYGRSLEEIDSKLLELRAEEYRVAFCCPYALSAVKFAQRHGCRYYPFNPSDSSKRDMVMEDVVKRWGEADVVLYIGCE